MKMFMLSHEKSDDTPSSALKLYVQHILQVQPCNAASLIAIFTTLPFQVFFFFFFDQNLIVCGRKCREEGAEPATASCFPSCSVKGVSVWAFRQSLPPVKLPRCNGLPASLNHIKTHEQEASPHCYYWDKDPTFTTHTIVILPTINLCLRLQYFPRKSLLLLEGRGKKLKVEKLY